MPGVFTALWLGGLWFVAPLLSPAGREISIASRLRDAVLLGTAVPIALGFVHLLSAPGCACAMAILAVIRTIIRPCRAIEPLFGSDRTRFVASVGRMIPNAAALAVTWPALVRPLLQGDSLGYHLPNAADWSVAHSVWTTGTWYWWYPGGSEMFASGLYTVAGPTSVSYAGFVALLMLSNRLAAFARRAGYGEIESGILAATLATIGTIGLQGGSLENDVWLSAWALELAWALLAEPDASARSLGVIGLVKPYGFILGAVVAISGRMKPRDVAIGSLPFAVWLVRDALLWHGAEIDPAALSYPHIVSTTIVAQGTLGLATLAVAIWNGGIGMTLASAALVTTVVFSREPIVRFSALGAFVIFVIEPFGFQNGSPQLATGASLRYAAPALVLGAIGALPLVRRFERPLAFFAVFLAAYQIAQITRIFASDATTHRWYAATLLLIFAVILDAFASRGIATRLVALALVAYSVRLAGSHPIDYYDDLVSGRGVKSHVFAWLAAIEPPEVVGDTLRLGTISAVSPATLVDNAVGSDGCARARRRKALLVVADDPPTTAALLAARRERAKQCGVVRYDDGLALVVAPSDAEVRQ
jgi:hypothetical protein